MSCQIRELCKKCELALSSHWCNGHPCDCEKPDVVEMRQSRHVFRPFRAWDRIWGNDSSHETFKHHTISELEKSALSCYVCFLLFDRLEHCVDDCLEIPIVSYLSITQTLEVGGLEIICEHVRIEYVKNDFHALIGPPKVRSSKIWLQPFSGQTTMPIHSGQIVQMNRMARCASQIRSWIGSCEISHGDCRGNRVVNAMETTLPSRLLQLSLCEDAPQVVLVSTTGLDLNTRYATLSHRWGSGQILKLLLDNEGSLRQEVPFWSLPRTFQEAVSICLAFGLRYLWIDSLCIIQDSRRDWYHEAPRMCTIYSKAWLGIAATFANDGHDGLLSQESFPLPSVVEANCTGKRMSVGKFVALDFDAWQKVIEQAPLNARAWVVQERILSPKTVHFASDQMWWSCMGLPIACEAMPEGYNRQGLNTWATNLLKDSFPASKWHVAWEKLVRTYMSAQITHISDRPMAVAGIAEAVARARSITPRDYLAGIWRKRFLESLLWYTSFFQTPLPHANSRSRLTSTPTWSWLSVNGPVYHSRTIWPRSSLAKLIDARTYPIGGLFGPVNGGHATLKGPLVSLRRSTDPQRYKGDDCELGASAFHTAHVDYFVIDDADLETIRMVPQPFGGLFDCWDWPAMGEEVFFACLDMDNDKSEEWNLVDGLLLTPFDRLDGGGVGYSRMTRLELLFGIGASLENYLRNHEQQYTIY